MKGMVSNVFLENGIIKKVYLDQTQYPNRCIESHWNNEVRILKLLKGKKHFPQIIKIGDKVIWMTYCGELLTKKNLPKDWEKQCKEIETTFDKNKIYHIDLTEIIKKKKIHKNICVNKGVIYVIDWGFWTKNRQQYEKETITEIINNIKK